MGWKNLKEHYRIEHQVRVTEEGICIGSVYIYDLIVVAADGTVKAKRDFMDRNGDLHRYRNEMEADPATVRRLIAEPDSFAASIPVFTYKGGEIIEELCEEPGWPNPTHKGHIQYENTFSTDKAKVVEWAKRNADRGVEDACEQIEDCEAKLVRWRERLARWEADRAKLEAAHPTGDVAT